jgi:single-stranded-DNA-specific exonuclease
MLTDQTLQLHRRDVPPRTVWALEQTGVHPLLARLFASRGVSSSDELDDALARLLPPAELRGAQGAACLLADAMAEQARLCVVADYDCDGATACAVALRGLKLLGAQPHTLRYVVPDRAVHGYGLTPGIVDVAQAKGCDVLITVDNGIASMEGVAHARALGMKVLVTDHHLPALRINKAQQTDEIVLPDAHVIVNPNQPDCRFPSKHLAGVGVMFYVLMALRSELRQRGVFGAADAIQQPRLDGLLDLVALGTVADVVKLDANNRRLVAQGLKRIRQGQMQAGVAALFNVAGRDPRQASSFDFGFGLGPRINAAGRLADMTLGIECLCTDDVPRANELAHILDGINRERRSLESDMREQAQLQVDALLSAQIEEMQGTPPAAIVIFDEGFHEGVVGIVASRLKDEWHRPVFVLARGRDGLLKGSGRSIAGFHLRDALDLVSKREPGVLLRFGGHAMAAGCTLEEAHWPRFAQALRQVAEEHLDEADLTRSVLSDGPLPEHYTNSQTARTLDAQVWGPAFEAPVFDDEVEVIEQRLVGEKHLKLTLRRQDTTHQAIWFGRSEPLPPSVHLAYRLSVDEYRGQERVQWVVQGLVSPVRPCDTGLRKS